MIHLWRKAIRERSLWAERTSTEKEESFTPRYLLAFQMETDCQKHPELGREWAVKRQPKCQHNNTSQLPSSENRPALIFYSWNEQSDTEKWRWKMSVLRVMYCHESWILGSHHIINTKYHFDWGCIGKFMAPDYCFRYRKGYNWQSEYKR